MLMKGLALAAVLALATIVVAGVVALASARGELSPGPDRQTVAAPIDQIEVLLRESSPPQVTLNVKVGLPSGCSQRDSYEVSRVVDTITVRVLNSIPAGNPICTMIYGSYELNIDLGSDFRPGGTYTVRVNDQTTTFKT